MPKLKNSFATFWAIFKQCASILNLLSSFWSQFWQLCYADREFMIYIQREKKRWKKINCLSFFSLFWHSWKYIPSKCQVKANNWFIIIPNWLRIFQFYLREWVRCSELWNIEVRWDKLMNVKVRWALEYWKWVGWYFEYWSSVS